MGLSARAGWNQTEQDWVRLLALEPEGCFGVECDGVVVATTTAVCYGRELAWIGMVLTAREYRGRGFARLLMERALDFLAGRGVKQIKLDATEMGAPLYRKLGFEDECPIERWIREPGLSMEAGQFEAGFDPALDREIFGVDRSVLLEQLAHTGAAVSPAGFAMDRPGANAAYFGPCVARSADGARRLVEWFLSRHGAEPTYWDLLAENTEAVRLATEFEFSRSRRLTRMASRSKVNIARADSSKLFAIAGFEYG